MNFYSVVDQAIALLRQRGRVTYRTLKRQFALDDDTLADLTEELIYGQRLAADEDGRVLVWTGDMPMVTEPHASQSPSGHPSTTHEDPSVQAATPPVLPMADAERRQLTVMFCDLVDSTALSGQLDPEDLRDVVRAYQEVAAVVVQRFEGYIAQYLGDGVLVYFGYPQAHEDDAQRTIRAALDLLQAMGPLNARLESDAGVRLAVRIGIHTGPVVVGDIGGGSRHERLALGETPNIAARLEGLATPNSIVISATTRQLVGGTFALEDLGVHALKGVAAPMQVYCVRGVRAIESRFEAATTTGLTPLVGRTGEVDVVLRRWEHAKRGAGQVVLLAGEPGIGKSRIVQTLCERVAEEPHTRLRYQCLPSYTNSAFFPIVTQLERAARFTRDDTPDQKLAKLEVLLGQSTASVAEVAPLIAALLSIPTGDHYPPLHLSPQRQKAQTIEVLADQLVGLSHHQPVLCIFEDTHWSDPTSLEVLDRIVHRVPGERVLVVITYRPEFEAPWRMLSHVTALTLHRLEQTQVATMVERLTGGKALPPVVLAQILVKTDGVPLFVEELTKTILESALLLEGDDHYALTGAFPLLAIPTTLHDSLMARLDRLATGKEVAQLGATLGREFSAEVLHAISPWDAETVDSGLSQLVAAELLSRRGLPRQVTYTFKHALIQDAAYQSLLRSTRQQYHQHIAQVLAAQFPETAETQSELLAHHYTEAGLFAQAIPYWQRAGERAVERSANVEAVGHFTKGLVLLKTLPDTPEHARQELALHIALGAPLMALHGLSAPEVGRAYGRARELCQQMRDTPELVPVLVGLWRFYLSQGVHQTARALAEQLLQLADRVQDPTLLLEAHRPLGQTLFYMGEFAPARAHLEQAIALYDPQEHRAHVFRYGHDAGVACLCHLSEVLWCLGAPDDALQRGHEALTVARELAHPQSLTFALFFTAMLHQFRREGPAVQERVEAIISLSTEQGFPYWLAVATILQGWVLAEQEEEEAGIAQMRKGLSAYQAVGSELWRPYFLALLAKAYGEAGQAEQGLTALAEARAIVEKTGERWWEAELHRVQGELLLQQAAGSGQRAEGEAETCFQQALDMARRQQAKSLELRAAMSLARLWQRHGKQADAHALLAPIYGWFTKGFDTADLQEAKVLLEE